MLDQMSGENAGPENQDRKMEDQRSECVFCRVNMRDCVVEKNAVVKQSLSNQYDTRLTSSNKLVNYSASSSRSSVIVSFSVFNIDLTVTVLMNAVYVCTAYICG